MSGYRRLPGKMRGILSGASVWWGGDHLLLVRSKGFREEYKRFYFRDVQAIVMARAPRFHLSTRAVVIGAAWLLATLWFVALRPYLWPVGPALALAWAVISGAFSCRCKIFTAVSADELPSVYRTWTAKAFLAAVEPKVAEAQGVIEGPWAEAAEMRTIGPAPTVPVAPATNPPAPAGEARTRTLASDLLIGVLFASGIFDFFTLRAAPGAFRGWSVALMAAKVGVALAVFVEHYRGRLSGGMQKVAVAALLAMGVMFYAQQMAVGFSAGVASANKKRMATVAPVIASENRLATEINGGVNLILACVGLGVVWTGRAKVSRAAGVEADL